MKEIKIYITDRDFKTIQEINLKAWHQTTPEEREQYQRLIQFYGTGVLHAVESS